MSFTLYEYQLKVDQGYEYKTWNFEASTGQSRGYTETKRHKQ
jgi:hypothetical protein